MVAVRLPFASFRFSGTNGVRALGPCCVSPCAGNATCIYLVTKALVPFPRAPAPSGGTGILPVLSDPRSPEVCNRRLSKHLWSR